MHRWPAYGHSSNRQVGSMPLQMPVPDGSPLGSGHTPVLGRQLSIPYAAPFCGGNRRFVRTKGELQKHRSRSQKALWEVL